VEKGVMASNKGLKRMDSSRRGYMLVERTTGEWRTVETVKQRTPRPGSLHRMTAKHEARKLCI
jgi:hypothetical protein